MDHRQMGPFYYLVLLEIVIYLEQGYIYDNVYIFTEHFIHQDCFSEVKYYSITFCTIFHR